jgi:hypothetical protein
VTRRSDLHFYLYTCIGSVRSNRSKRAAKLKSSLGAFIAFGGVFTLMQVAPANAASDIDNLRLYAHSRIINYKQFQCFNQLIIKESNWSVNARNGSHYGLGQMRNPKYRVLDGYTQIDWSLRYIAKRYGNSCKAYEFFRKHGYH